MSERRLLIAAGSSGDDLVEVPSGVRELIDGATEILVMAPTLPTRLQWLASDTDRTRELADERLQEVLEQLEDTDDDTEISGTVGGDDRLLAFQEAAAGFDPHHILLALRPGKRSGWQEKGLVDELLDTFGLPVTVFTADS